MSKHILIFFVVTILSVNLISAHNPLSASYFLESKGNFGVLNISLSQAGLHEAVKKEFPNKDFETLSNEVYKRLIVQYLKESFLLKIDNENIDLKDGGIKLGNHQTDIKFITSNLPIEFQNIEVEIDAFKKNKNHQTIFSVAIHGYKNKVILSQDNRYIGSLGIVDKKKDDKVALQSESKATINYLWLLCLIPFSIFFLFRKMNLKKI